MPRGGLTPAHAAQGTPREDLNGLCARRGRLSRRGRDRGSGGRGDDRRLLPRDSHRRDRRAASGHGEPRIDQRIDRRACPARPSYGNGCLPTRAR